MKTDREKMPIILRRTERGLEPRSQLARDALAQYAVHSDVEISIKKKRSMPQLRLYWAMLQNVVAATDAWASAEHLHDALKLDLGYTTPVKTMDRKLVMIPDSVALAKMDSAQFQRFFDAAAARLAEVCGFDPLAEAQEAA